MDTEMVEVITRTIPIVLAAKAAEGEQQPQTLPKCGEKDCQRSDSCFRKRCRFPGAGE